jgi:hypothetical protein
VNAIRFMIRPGDPLFEIRFFDGEEESCDAHQCMPNPFFPTSNGKSKGRRRMHVFVVPLGTDKQFILRQMSNGLCLYHHNNICCDCHYIGMFNCSYKSSNGPNPKP